MVQVSGTSLPLEDHGSGRLVLLLYGWPDSAYLWRIPFLRENSLTKKHMPFTNQIIP